MKKAPAKRGLRILLAFLAIGFAVAIYLVIAHLRLFHGTGSFESLCNFGARLSCDAVNTSDYAEIFGVAIALFALPFYGVLGFLVLRAFRAASNTRATLAFAHALTWPALAYSAFLLAVMLIEVGSLCLFCVTLDAVNVAAFVITARAAGASPKQLIGEFPAILREHGRNLVAPSMAIGAGIFAVSLVGHGWLRSKLEAEARAAVLSTSSVASTGEAPATGVGRKLPTKRWQVPVDENDATVGPTNARVTVVEFADFQCGYCKRLELAMTAVRQKYADRVRFVFKHFPMNATCNPSVKYVKHANACEAAKSAECARRQNKFWPMHAELYANQYRLARSDLTQHAANAGLDLAAYSACMDDPQTLAAISKDSEEGGRLNVEATPRTFINGRLFGGALSEDLLSFVIRVELGEVTGKEAEAYVGPVSSAQPETDPRDDN